MEYKLGSKDKQVGVIQSHLNRVREEVLQAKDTKYKVSNDWSYLAVDNDFGSLTEKAVRGFQRMKGITENGIVGNTTWNNLSTFSLYSSISTAPVFSGIYKVGSKGAEVKEIQTLLNRAWETLTPDIRTAYRWEYIAVDGVFGERTKAAVMAFQNYRKIEPVSGRVGDTTMNYLRNFQSFVGKRLIRNAISKAESLAAQQTLEDTLKSLLDTFIKITKEFLDTNISNLVQRNTIETNVLEKYNRALKNQLSLEDSSMTRARRNLAMSCQYRQSATHLMNTTFYRRINEFVSPIGESVKTLRTNQTTSWNCAQRRVFDAIKHYDISKKIETKINLYTNKNQITQGCITKIGGLSKACAFIGFILQWGNFILLIATYEDTKEWNEKMNKCIYSLMDQLIAELVAAFVGLVITVLAALGIIAMPAAWVVGLVCIFVGLLCALIIWLLEDPENDIYPSKYLQDASYKATFQLLCQ